jgi:hypothetical protein
MKRLLCRRLSGGSREAQSSSRGSQCLLDAAEVFLRWGPVVRSFKERAASLDQHCVRSKDFVRCMDLEASLVER